MIFNVILVGPSWVDNIHRYQMKYVARPFISFWITTFVQMTLNSFFLPPAQLWLKHYSHSRLQNAIQQISSCMIANLLSLNSSNETEVALHKQFAKIHNSSLNTAHYAGNIVFILVGHLTSSDHISSFSKSCNWHIRELRYIRTYLHSKKNLCFRLSRSLRTRSL